MNQRRASNKNAKPQSVRSSASRSESLTRLAGIFQRAIVLLLAVIGFLFCLITSYQLNVNVVRLVGSAIIFTALFVVIYSNKRRELLLLISFLAALFWVWRNSASFMQGMLVFIEQGLSPLALHLPDFLQIQIQAYDAQQAVFLTTIGVQVSLFLVALFGGYFVVYRSSMAGLALSTLPLLFPAAFFSLEPAIVPSFCLAGAHIMLFIRSTATRLPSYEEANTSDNDSDKPPVCPTYSRIPQQMTFLALPMILLAALLSSLLLPRNGYERPENIETLQQKIFSLDLGNIGQRSNDGLTRGDLRALSTIRFTGKTVLKFSTTLEKPYYLRDYAGTFFTNDGWQSASDTSYADYESRFIGIAPQNLSADAAIVGGAQYQPYSLSVQNIAATSSSIWIPNGLATTAEEIPNAAYVQDAALHFTKSSDFYTVTALPREAVLTALPFSNGDTLRSAYLAAAGSSFGLQNVGGLDAQSVQSAAQAYIEYAFDTYTVLPDNTRLAAEKLIDTYGLSVHIEDGTLDLFETCHDLYNLLTTQCSYAYSPAKIPSDADFVTYFIEESQQGYCVHFATSAAVLLRSLGIPARYAEGYIVVSSDYDKQPDANGYIEIEDTHAHAWVEVFDPAQLEWIPFEMTASANGSADSTPDPENTGDAGYTETPTPEPTPEPTPTEEPTPEPSADISPFDDSESDDAETPDASDSDEPTPAAESPATESESFVTPTPDPSSQDGYDGNGGVQQDNSETSERFQIWPFIVVLLSGGLLFAAYGWRKASIRRLKRQLRQRNVNASVLAVCRYALRMLRFAGCEKLQPLQTPEDYAAIAAARLPWIDRNRLCSMIELAQRARFSNTTCTRQDWNDAASFAAAIHAGLVAGLPRMRRWIFRLRFPVL